MKHFKWQLAFGLSLVFLSALLYFIHYMIFADARHIFIYFLGDIAFVPIEVLLVTLIIHRMLNVREKRAMFKKLNMVIGAFFSEVGADLLKYFSQFNPEADKIRKDILSSDYWTGQEYSDTRRRIRGYDCKIESQRGDLGLLRGFLMSKRDFLLRLLENPNLLEHDSFTELLWAVFHLTEELTKRKNINKLSLADYEHISLDIKRAYLLLIKEWVIYMKHLKDDYPYLFSLALRTNPFDPGASAEIK